MTHVERLFALEQFGIGLGLDAMRVLLAGLGDPQLRWPGVHVAGTNGKGSVTAMVDIGVAGGRATRRPLHLAAPGANRRAGGDRRPERDARRVRRPPGPGLHGRRRGLYLGVIGTLASVPTFFEVSTAAAFLAFADADVDVAVVEVGLGGRYDATNLILPAVLAITSIEFDHEQHLGHTIAAIAAEKAGIAKAGVPLVMGAVSAEARAVIAAAAAGAGAPLVPVQDGTTAVTSIEAGHAVVRFTTPGRAYPPVRLGLAGSHQAGNAAVAVRVLETLEERRPFGVGLDAVIAGLRDVRWPARLEWLRHARTGARVLADAAHNPAGGRAGPSRRRRSAYYAGDLGDARQGPGRRVGPAAAVGVSGDRHAGRHTARQRTASARRSVRADWARRGSRRGRGTRSVGGGARRAGSP